MVILVNLNGTFLPGALQYLMIDADLGRMGSATILEAYKGREP